MEPENTIPENSKKKFFIIALGILVIAGALGYLFMQKNTRLLPQEEKVSLPIKTQAQIEQEKLIVQMVQAIPKNTMTQTERNQLVKSIPKKTTLSSEEQTKLLQSIPQSAIQ